MCGGGPDSFGSRQNLGVDNELSGKEFLHQLSDY
jgi:hypothetical protein